MVHIHMYTWSQFPFLKGWQTVFRGSTVCQVGDTAVNRQNLSSHRFALMIDTEMLLPCRQRAKGTKR